MSNLSLGFFVLCTISFASSANLYLSNLMRPDPNYKICVNEMCNSTANYPEGKILRAISRNESFDSMFGTVIEPSVRVASRFGSDIRNMCPSTKLTLAPRIAKNIKGEWKFIVNVDKHRQFVTTETCDENAKCFENWSKKNQDNFECQSYNVVIRFLVYNPETTSFDIDYFSIPSGCYCTYKSNATLKACHL